MKPNNCIKKLTQALLEKMEHVSEKIPVVTLSPAMFLASDLFKNPLFSLITDLDNPERLNDP